MNNNNYYQELNVSSSATNDEIKAAYRKLAFEYHPDRNEGDAKAADRMKAVNEAYAVLSDPVKRRQYDTLFQTYGDGATSQFRQSFSDQEIFRGSDIQQIFEEMARAFGLRGFDDIFKDFYGQGFQTFEFQQPGMFGKGFMFKAGSADNRSSVQNPGMMGKLAQKLLGKLTGIYLPQQGENLQDEIVLQPEFARQGGPFAYHHRSNDKKLVVHIPEGVRDGQIIRLTGMGKPGTHGAPSGDLLLRVKISKPFLKKIKNALGLTDT